jgi:hypothetical protein
MKVYQLIGSGIEDLGDYEERGLSHIHSRKVFSDYNQALLYKETFIKECKTLHYVFSSTITIIELELD